MESEPKIKRRAFVQVIARPPQDRLGPGRSETARLVHQESDRMGFVDEAKPAVFEALAIVGGVKKDAASG
jgi:hypothetical protein